MSETSGYRIVAIISPCHGEDTGSTPVTRSKMILMNKMRRNKYFSSNLTTSKSKLIILAILFLLFCAIGFGYSEYYSGWRLADDKKPITDELSVNSVYVNSEYGFEIEIPEGFKILDQSPSLNGRKFLIHDAGISDYLIDTYLSFEILDTKTTYSNEFILSEVNLAGKSSIKLVDSSLTSIFDIYQIELADNKGYLEINVSNLPTKTETANDILSTLRFLN